MARESEGNGAQSIITGLHLIMAEAGEAQKRPAPTDRLGSEEIVIDFHTHILPRDVPDYKVRERAAFRRPSWRGRVGSRLGRIGGWMLG